MSYLIPLYKHHYERFRRGFRNRDWRSDLFLESQTTNQSQFAYLKGLHALFRDSNHFVVSVPCERLNLRYLTV